MNPKISIIVPVYKVEEYIHKCLDSILNQTFEDFELILVDDGSPDKCGEICDEYAKKDNRVVIIHKENGGLSSARNAGIDIARGKYIGFVDSDDYIEPDMYELLYSICENHDCDIASCSSVIYFKDKTVINGGHKLEFHNKKEAMKIMLNGKLYDEVVWVKLFKKSVIGKIRFPEGRIYEDTSFTYKVIHNSEKIATIGKAKYNYIKHDRSIMNTAIKNINTDAIIAYKEMYDFIKESYPELLSLVTLKLSNSSLVILNNIIRSNNFSQNKLKYYETAKFLNSYFKETIKLKEYPKNLKILLLTLKINPVIYKYLIKIIKLRR